MASCTIRLQVSLVTCRQNPIRHFQCFEISFKCVYPFLTWPSSSIATVRVCIWMPVLVHSLHMVGSLVPYTYGADFSRLSCQVVSLTPQLPKNCSRHRRQILRRIPHSRRSPAAPYPAGNGIASYQKRSLNGPYDMKMRLGVECRGA